MVVDDKKFCGVVSYVYNSKWVWEYSPPRKLLYSYTPIELHYVRFLKLIFGYSLQRLNYTSCRQTESSVKYMYKSLNTTTLSIYDLSSLSTTQIYRVWDTRKFLKSKQYLAFLIKDIESFV
jgi:hypothetical protein